ncbi:Ig-like domain-containing protein [Pontiella sp.]|uniref:Ig-like domain-containing protein n=1 Tax=Pontiella sp. TaxID=2837462 RepID=UPI003563B5BC
MKTRLLLSFFALATAWAWAAAPTIQLNFENPYSIDEDHMASGLSFFIADDDTDANDLTIAKNSSNTTLVPLNNMNLGGSGTNRTLTVAPALNQYGSTQISIMVTDTNNVSATNTFTLQVNSVNDPPTIANPGDVSMQEDSTKQITLTVGDVDNPSTELSFTARSDNQALIPDANIVSSLGSDGSTLTVFLQPLPNMYGSCNVTITVRDKAGDIDSTAFKVTVANENDTPSIDFSISPATINENVTTTTPFQLTITDPDTNDTFTIELAVVNDPGNAVGSFSTSPLFTGSKSSAEAWVAALGYKPKNNVISGSSNLTIRITVSDGQTDPVEKTATLTILEVTEAVSILGVELEPFRINEGDEIVPFPSVVIFDNEETGTARVEIELDTVPSGKGAFEPASLTNSSTAAATEWIKGVQFTAGNVPLGTTESARLRIKVTTVSGGTQSYTYNSRTEVIISEAINYPPQILNVPAHQPVIIPLEAPYPFLDYVTIQDNDEVTLSIDLDDPGKGELLFEGSAFSSTNDSVEAINSLLSNLYYQVSDSYAFADNLPGDTTFSIIVEDSGGSVASDTLRVLVLEPASNLVVYLTGDDVNTTGTLRHAVNRASNDDTITFAFDYPAGASTPEVIRLTNGVITLTKNLNFKGPGADLLVISGDTDGNLQPDTQLFRVEANVAMEGLTLSHGTAQYGGAISVGPTGALTMRDCQIRDCTAEQWGGAIDVEEGWLAMAGCLLRNNSTDPSSGLGGGAVSLWTDQDCGFLNTTFSGNRQRSPSGYGGGALYAENYTPASYFEVGLVHCTFAGNTDEAQVASSIYANGFGTQVKPANSIFADGSGYNLGVAGAGEIRSYGGNVSDDWTYTVYMQGGEPQAVMLLDPPLDRVNTDPLLDPLSAPESPTDLYPLQSASPAIDWATADRTAIDQRGALRDAAPDSGAYEADAEQRILINEIQVNAPGFIEFFVPRNAEAVALTNHVVFVDGAEVCHLTNTTVNTGFGLLIAQQSLDGYAHPSEVISSPLLDLKERGTVTLTDGDQNIIAHVAYNGVFERVGDFDPGQYETHSLTLNPQYRGFANLPHGWFEAGLAQSPGADADGTPFGLPNAPPIAFPDVFVVHEDDVSWLGVLANDYDADGDPLSITGLPAPAPTYVTGNGATCSIAQTGSTFAVRYDPTLATAIQRLPEGAELSDTFDYTITDGIGRSGRGTIVYIEESELYTDVIMLDTDAPHTINPNEEGELIEFHVPSMGSNATVYAYRIIAVESDTRILLANPIGNDAVPYEPLEGEWLFGEPSDSTTTVNLTILGANDAPAANPDGAGCDEDEPLTFTAADLLANDDDIDTDDDTASLQLVGIVQTSTTNEAAVSINLRANPAETTLVYDPSVSAMLDALGAGEFGIDTFGYVVADRHGAMSTGIVEVTVWGVNDEPISGDDPANLLPLLPYIGAGETVADVLSNLVVLDAIPTAAGTPGRMDARIIINGTFGEEDSIVLTNLFATPASAQLFISEGEILANDSDVDTNDRLRIDSTSPSDHGVATGIGSGGIRYEAPGSTDLEALARGEQLLDWFEIEIGDGHGGTTKNLVAVLVTGVNDRPFAGTDWLAVREDESVGFNAMANDRVVDFNNSAPDNALWIVSASGASTLQGSYAIGTNGTAFYDPAVSAFLDGLPEGYVTNDTFTYELTDQSFVFACDDLFRVDPDGTGAVLRVMANDINHNQRAGAIRIASIGIPGHGGSVEPAANSTAIRYQPEINFVGDEVFTYTITDPFGNTDKGRVTVRVTSEAFNGDLQANADSFTVALGETVTLDLLANDNRRPNAGAALDIVALATNGLHGIVVRSGNRVRYTATTPLGDAFTYTISGGGPARATATVAIKVVDRRHTLPVRNDSFAILRDSIDKTLDVLANDRILPDEPEYQLRSVGLPQHGAALIVDNELRYTPNAGFVGIDRFGYEATDGLGGTGTGVVEVAVGALLAKEDVFSVGYGGVDVVLDVLANDRIQPEEQGSVSIVALQLGQGLSGYVENRTNDLVFTVPPDPMGQYEFSYVVGDGERSATGTVTVAVEADGAYANPDYLAVLAGSSGVELDVLNNDASVRSVPRTVVATAIGTGDDAPNQGGTAVVMGDHILYTPAPGFVGEETFTYSMTDSLGTDTAKVVVEVRPPEMVACNDAFIVYFDPSAPAFALPVLNNDVLLPPAGTLQIENAELNISADGRSLEYTPTTIGWFTNHYEISDGGTRRAQATVEIEVRLRTGELMLEANPDVWSVARGSSANRFSPLANDGTLPAGADSWTVAIASPCTNGGIAVVSGSNILFTPDPDFTGLDGFAYSVSDGLGGTATNAVAVRVGEILLNPDCFSALSGTTNLFDVLANDGRQPDGPVLTNLMGGTNGRMVYIPPPANDYPFIDTVAYAVEVHPGLYATQMVSVLVEEFDSDRSTALVDIEVTGVNDPPVLGEFGDVLETADNVPIKPFPFAKIVDVDLWSNELQRVVITIDEAVKGSLLPLNGFSNPQPGRYEITNTPAVVSAALNGLFFVPAANRIEAGMNETAVLDVSVEDFHIASPLAHRLEIIVWADNDPGTFLDAWKILYFGAGGAPGAADENDQDGDGLVNIAEYAFGTDPTQRTAPAMHSLVWEDGAAVGTLVASFQRQSDDPSLLYVLEKSTDMQTWENAAAWIIATTNTPPTEGIQRSINVIDIENDDNCYYRVNVYY